MLTGEPFCVSPDVYVRLTDWQIARMVRHAVRRAKEQERQIHKARGTAPPPPKSRKGLSKRRPLGEQIPREQFVKTGLMFGKSPEASGAEWDRANAAWEEARRGRKGDGGDQPV